MFNSISWQGYWIAIALLTVLYYLIICLLYYRSNLIAWIQHLQHRIPKGIPSASVPYLQKPEQSNETYQPSLFEASEDINLPIADKDASLVKDFTDELTAFLRQTKQQRPERQELLYGLQRLLNKYPALKQVAYKEVLSRLLIERCEQICSIHLRAEEQVRIWEEG